MSNTPQQPGGAMPITGHFGEMRDRLLRAVIGVVVGTVIAFVIWEPLMQFLLWPAPDGINLQAIGVLESLSVTFTVAFTFGVIVSMPWVLYQLFAFIKPALTDREKRYVYMAVPFIAGLFFLGVAFTYFIALPPALNFLLGWGDGMWAVQPQIKDYVSLVTRMLLVMGICFELPLLFMTLANFGIIKKGFLSKWRRIWIVLAFVISAIITPTIDPINQTIIAGALIVLYEASILLVNIAANRREKRLQKEAARELAQAQQTE